MMKLNQEVSTLLGFAQKANILVSGDSAVEALMKKQKIKLLILANDLSENRKKHFSNWSKDINIPLVNLGNKVDLGLALGMSPRSVIGITDQQMASAICKKVGL